MKENYGNLASLQNLEKINGRNFTVEQLLNENLKNEDGENRKEVTKRMQEAFYKVFNENINKNIAIVSHGAAIKFLLMKWCKLNNDYNLEYDNKEIILNSPGVIQLTFQEGKLLELKQII